MREKGIDKYEKVHVQALSIEFLRRQEREPSASRTFVRLILLDYKRTRQSRQPVSNNAVSLA